MKFILGATLLSAAAAQSVTSVSSTRAALFPTVSILIPGADPQPIVASVISANPSVTAYRINCPATASPNDCGLGAGAYITVSSTSIVQFSYTYGTAVNFNYRCTVQGSAICSETLLGGAAGSAISTVVTIPQASVTYLPVVVTAGAELLRATSSGASGSGSTASTAPMTGSSSSRTGSASASPSASGNAAANIDINAFTFTGLLSVMLGLLY